jgi:hypothetical protein
MQTSLSLQALKAMMPALSACIHRCAAETEVGSDGAELCDDCWIIKRVGELVSKTLSSLTLAANRALLCMVAEVAPEMALVSHTNNDTFDASLLVHLLSSAECLGLLKSFLGWQNGVRKQLGNLLELRKGMMQSDHTERKEASRKVDAAVAKFVGHCNALMPKGSLTCGAVKNMLEQRDNKLFEGIATVCLNSAVESKAPPGA